MKKISIRYRGSLRISEAVLDRLTNYGLSPIRVSGSYCTEVLEIDGTNGTGETNDGTDGIGKTDYYFKQETSIPPASEMEKILWDMGLSSMKVLELE